MKNLLIIIVSLLIASIPSLLLYWRERKGRIKSQTMLAAVKEMGEIDDRIFRIRLDDPEDWPTSHESQTLIVRRIELHEKYSTFLGHQLLRDCSYVSDLMKSVISVK